MRPLGTCVMVALVLLVHGPLNAEAQPRTPHVALLSIGTDPARPLPPQWVAFFDGLRALGYVDGRNIVIEPRFAGGNAELVTDFATQAVQRKVDVIVVTGTREVQAARRATQTIPIVTIVAPDLVAAGLISSLAQPGGNITGLTFTASGVGGKYVELLREAVPSATRIDVLASRPQAPGFEREMLDAARLLKLTLSPMTIVQRPEDFEPFFARAKREGTAGLIVPSDGVTNLHRQKIVDLAARYRLPAIYTLREHVEVGGLMAYGASFPDLFRRSATFVDKILKGARPAELPVEQPTKFELVINLKTARALGLTIPQTLLARADDLIQ